MLPIPSAIDRAKKLIKDNPNIFKDDTLTLLAITQALIEYNYECSMVIFDNYVETDLKTATHEEL